MQQGWNHYRFGAIEMGKKGMACYYPQEKLTAKVKALTIEQGREAYRDAREQLTSALVALKRYNNVSRYDWGIYERAAQHAYMAESVLAALKAHFTKQ